MASTKNFDLRERTENTREMRPAPILRQFSLDEIVRHFTDNMEEVRNQFVIADKLLAEDNEVACKLIWRSQIVLAVALLDFYLHEMTKYCLVRMFSNEWPRSRKYSDLKISIVDFEAGVMAQDPNKWFFEFVNDQFASKPFVSASTIKSQLALIGIGYEHMTERAFSAELSLHEKNKIINEVCQRRNAIAHQNDRSHESAEQADISKGLVEQYLNTIESIVDAIHSIAKEKDTQKSSQ